MTTKLSPAQQKVIDAMATGAQLSAECSLFGRWSFELNSEDVPKRTVLALMRRELVDYADVLNGPTGNPYAVVLTDAGAAAATKPSAVSKTLRQEASRFPADAPYDDPFADSVIPYEPDFEPLDEINGDDTRGVYDPFADSDSIESDDLPYDLNPIKIGNGRVYLNPGTGAVHDATEANAATNTEQFVKDSKLTGLTFEHVPDADYGDGRFAFNVKWSGAPNLVEIQMPGLTLEKVRYLGLEGQNIWHFPRLYVDGSSWVWQYAILDAVSFGVDDSNDLVYVSADLLGDALISDAPDSRDTLTGIVHSDGSVNRVAGWPDADLDGLLIGKRQTKAATSAATE